MEYSEWINRIGTGEKKKLWPILLLWWEILWSCEYNLHLHTALRLIRISVPRLLHYLSLRAALHTSVSILLRIYTSPFCEAPSSADFRPVRIYFRIYLFLLYCRSDGHNNFQRITLGFIFLARSFNSVIRNEPKCIIEGQVLPIGTTQRMVII